MLQDISYLCIFCACLSMSASIVSSKPVLDKTPVNITVIDGRSAFLPCQVTDKGDVTVIWMRGRAAVTLNDRRTVADERISVQRPYPNDWILNIRQVTETDEGIYECVVTTRPVQRKRVYLQVLVPPSIPYSTSDSDILEGQGASLLCNAEGDPIPNVTWFRELDSQKVPIGEGNKYTIKNVQKDDRGVYECVASNDVPPSARRRINIDVVFPPEVTVASNMIGQHIGENTVLCCDVNSYPRPVVHFQKDGDEIQIDDRHEISSMVTSEYTTTTCLEMSMLTLDDFGIYNCKASNTYGEHNGTIELYVRHISPVIQTPEARIGKKQGEYTAIECSITAYPRPKLQFKRWDRVVETDDRISIEIFQDDFAVFGMMLNIVSTQSSDYGIYVCEAENEAGRADADIELYELGDPVFDTSPITISAARLAQASLPCAVTDLGSNIVMWRGPGRKPISIGDRMTSSDRRFSVLPRPYKEEWNLKINGVKLSDAGMYECIINTRPMQIKNITLVIPEPPRITEDSSPTRENVTEGSYISLECYAEGTPMPTIQWYRAIQDESGRDEILEDLDTEGNELRLESVSKESAGIYVCEASNGIQPNAKRRIRLVVSYQPITTLSKFSIGQFLGRTVTLECYSEGVPLPSIIWTRNGRRLRDNWKYAIQLYQENDITSVSTLAIQSLELEDFGKYACESFNSQGQSTQLANIYAAGAPVIARSKSTRDTRLSEGNNLTLVCFARGIPKPTVTWYKVSNDNVSMDFEEIGSGREVIIEDVKKQNSGDYRCIASSVLGNSSLQIHIQVDVKLQVLIEKSRIGYEVGDEVILECLVRGSPEPSSISWIKTSNENSTWEHMIEIHKHNDSLRKIFMKIESIDIEDFGEYICSAENIHSSISKKIEIYQLVTTTTTTTTTQATAKPIKDKDTTTSKQHSTKPTEESGAASSTGVHDGASSIVISWASSLFICVIHLVYMIRT